MKPTKEDTYISKTRVGDIMIDKSGIIWVVSRKHEWERFYDYELRNKENGEVGSVRIKK